MQRNISLIKDILMKQIAVDYETNSQITNEELKQYIDILKPELEIIKKAKALNYSTDYASINLPLDKSIAKHVLELTAQKKILNPTMMIIVGLGGSNLGTMAIHRAIHGMYHNEKKNIIKLYFADTVDEISIHNLAVIMHQEYKNGGKVLLNIISKSGKTTETIALAQIFYTILLELQPEAFRYIIVTTDEDTDLYRLAKNKHFDLLTIPKKVGGRYSVFSSVGLFPLAMMGIDIQELLHGAQDMRISCTEKLYDNPAAISASILYHAYNKKFSIHDSFFFVKDYESLGKWYRQLLAESIGKTSMHDGKKVNIGLTPTISIGSTDLHSVGQLYLGGPYDKITTFITLDQYAHHEKISEDILSALVPNLANKNLSDIMNAIIAGVQLSYLHDKRPFMINRIPKNNPYYIGQWMQLKMFEVIFLGYLFKVNPFDQPEVELYKIETKAKLAHE